MESRMQFLRPGQVLARLKEYPVVYIPFGPLEWHGPHLPLGMDPLNAEGVARAACAQTGGLVWPTQYWGTERERRPEQLASLGLKAGSYVVGMDFPNHSMPSMYCPEEIFALLVRDLLRQVITLGAKAAILVNGHGAENHVAVFKRLTTEFNNTTALKVLFRIAAPNYVIEGGSGEHAGLMETSILMHLHPEAVDLKELPPLTTPLKYADYGIVDGEGFDGAGGPGHAVPPHEDPRLHSNPGLGRKLSEDTAVDLAAQVRKLMAGAAPGEMPAITPAARRKAGSRTGKSTAGKRNALAKS